MKSQQTPLMRQYSAIKKKYPDSILLFRMGDFFETFGDDAEITARVCGIVLTKRNNGGAMDMPLAGFPHHQLDNYLPKLVRGGYRVAVCEQLEDPKFARGIVKRGVIEVVTPGVALYDKLLESKTNNYALAIAVPSGKQSNTDYGLSFVDISTGEFFVAEIPQSKLNNFIEMLAPAEVLFSKSSKEKLQPFIEKTSVKPAITKLEPWIFDEEFGRQGLLGHFKTHNLKGFGIDDFTSAIAAAGALLYYLNETQQTQLSHISRIQPFNHSDFMLLDYSTRRNLEIVYSYSDNSSNGTLISTLDRTATPMGGRLFKRWLTRPLIKLDAILARQAVVEELFNSEDIRKKLRSALASIADIERIVSKICTGRANPRDLALLKDSLLVYASITEIIAASNCKSLKTFAENAAPAIEISKIIGRAVLDEPAIQFGNGTIFKRGYSAELDSFVEAKLSGKDWISRYQEKERNETGITSLKVSYNSIFGYFIEVTNSHKNKVPQHYQRKATLTNAERFITPELKEIETRILNAEAKILELEQQLFAELNAVLAGNVEQLQVISKKIANIDCFQSFAEISKLFNYTKPELSESFEMEIIGGRHPVVERLLPIGEKFTPNSTVFNENGEMIHIITGPNMSGKSCYLRQVGLIVLLAQIGCYVPADKAKIGIVDRIFTRVGAQDNITSGESTFLVEMQEAANIMNNATSRSLILLDEVGRGTATYDGISIAWAIAEYIHNEIRSKTLFATHYHELNELASRYDNIANYRVEALETGGTVIFTHKVMKGGSDHSFGIHVAQMAGIPMDVIERSKEIMATLEKDDEPSNNKKSLKPKSESLNAIDIKRKAAQSTQMSIFEFHDDELRSRIASIDLNQLTPLKAFQILTEIYMEIKRAQQ